MGNTKIVTNRIAPMLRRVTAMNVIIYDRKISHDMCHTICICCPRSQCIVIISFAHLNYYCWVCSKSVDGERAGATIIGNTM